MIFYPEWIKDSVGNNYIAINVWQNLVWPYLKVLREIVDTQADYDKLIQNQKSRDGNKYHITVFSVAEVDQLIKKYGFEDSTKIFDEVNKLKLDDVKLQGIGKAEKAGSIAYFIIASSMTLNYIREKYGLSPKDLHVTLGFNPKDVHGVSKNVPIKEISGFLKLFKNLFYSDPSLEDLKLIKNFDLDYDIEPIELTETNIKVRCGEYYVLIGSLEYEPKLWVMAQWPIAGSELDKQPLTQTDITKFIKQHEQ